MSNKHLFSQNSIYWVLDDVTEHENESMKKVQKDWEGVWSRVVTNYSKITQNEIPEFILKFIHNKTLILEGRCGYGVQMLRFCNLGATCIGIDITKNPMIAFKRNGSTNRDK